METPGDADLAPAGPAPSHAPWGRRGSLYNFDTCRLLAPFLGPRSLSLVQGAARVTDAQVASEGGRFSMGALVSHLASLRGIPLGVAGRAGVVLDALAVAVDLADNIADAEEDAAERREFEIAYDGLPYASLVALPALIVGAVIAALPRNFPDGRFHTAYAAQRLLGVLDVLVVGQERDADDPLRVEEISAVQGRLYALPWWLVHGPDAEAAEAIETWGVAFGRTWQARRDAVEREGDARARLRYDEARATARTVWPQGSPFGPGELLAFETVVPELS